MAVRTDLAMEAKALWEKSAEKTTKLEGVRASENDGITLVEILDDRGVSALGKPIGRYLTMELPKYCTDVRKTAEKLARQLENLIDWEPYRNVLVVGLGNRAITPDALGPMTVEKLLLTRHLIQNLPQQFGSCRSVSALSPGVLATTGIETLETVKGAVEHVRPDCLIAVDALAAGSMERLCNTLQISDSGIAPGSGVGNRREAFNQETLHIPVYAIGVPTVVDAQTDDHMIVTPKDIDARVHFLSAVLAGGLNLVLHPEFDYDDFAQF